MLPFRIDPAQAEVALRALKMVATASEGIHATEAALLRAAASAFGLPASFGALAALEPLDPAEAAKVIPDEVTRTRLVEAMMLMALMDQEVDEAELAVIDRFAGVLGIEEPRVRNLHQLVDGDHTRMKLDFMRRGYFGRYVVPEAWESAGVKGLWKAFAPRIGLATDADLAWKYKELGLLPAGTLGREYWTHCMQRHFSFPGEPYGFEWQVVHDMGHLLGGHETDPHGEIEQAAFEAGYMRRDPFFFIFTTTMMFHLGVAVVGDDYLGLSKGAFEPERAVHAFERGLAVKTDLTQWDYWPHVKRPIADVRAELGIEARPEVLRIES